MSITAELLVASCVFPRVSPAVFIFFIEHNESIATMLFQKTEQSISYTRMLLLYIAVCLCCLCMKQPFRSIRTFICLYRLIKHLTYLAIPPVFIVVVTGKAATYLQTGHRRVCKPTTASLGPSTPLYTRYVGQICSGIQPHSL